MMIVLHAGLVIIAEVLQVVNQKVDASQVRFVQQVQIIPELKLNLVTSHLKDHLNSNNVNQALTLTRLVNQNAFNVRQDLIAQNMQQQSWKHAKLVTIVLLRSISETEELHTRQWNVQEVHSKVKLMLLYLLIVKHAHQTVIVARKDLIVLKEDVLPDIIVNLVLRNKNQFSKTHLSMTTMVTADLVCTVLIQRL